MKRVAICTLFHKNYNYGGSLQGLALQNVLRDMGLDAYLVTYNDKANKNPIYTTLLSRCTQYSFIEICCKIKEILTATTHSEIKAKIKPRIELFDRFISNNFYMTDLYSDGSLSLLEKEFDVIISGSDQVWNPNAVRKLYLQDFSVSNGTKKVAYAASISRNKLNNKEAKIMIPCIEKFDAIGVREKTASDILGSFGIKDAKIVLDPTMLLSVDEWNNVAAPCFVTEPYVLVYSFSDCPFKDSLSDFYIKKNMKVVFIPYAKQKYNSFDNNCDLIPMWNVGPAEFLSLIKNSEFVYTDSFHGSVFSILFNKQFAVYERDKSGTTSKNSRMYDLLSIFGLDSRMIRDDHKKVLENKIDFSNVNEILEKKRIESWTWLKDAVDSQ